MTNEQKNSNSEQDNTNYGEPNIKWEYKILNINVETTIPPKSDPVKDSEKLNGYLRGKNVSEIKNVLQMVAKRMHIKMAEEKQFIAVHIW